MRLPDRAGVRARLAVAAVILGTPLALDPAWAADPAPESRLKAVEQRIDESKKTSAQLDRQAAQLAADIDRLQDAAVAAAHIAQNNEARLTELEGQLTQLAKDEAVETQALELRRLHEAKVLAALQRLSRNPPVALAFGPEAPLDGVRTGILLAAAVPRLQNEAGSIAQDLEKLRATRAELNARRAEAAERQAALEAERQRIAALAVQKQQLEGHTTADAQAAQKELAALTSEAGGLRELIQQLEQERQRRRIAAAAARARADARAAEAARRAVSSSTSKPVVAAAAPRESSRDPLAPGRTMRRLEQGKSTLVMPVAGQIVKRFGDGDSFATSQGLTISARAGAQVVSPFDGQIMFAGPFKGYGQILIIDHGGGYHSVLAGIDRINAVVGQWVVAGEPVGVMRSDVTSPSLYLEFRRQGQPINPLPWLAAHDGKVSG